MAAGVLHFSGYLGQSGSRCALLAGWDTVVHKSRTTAAVAAGATYLVGKDLEMSNSGLDSLERVQHLLPAAGANYLAGKESINRSGNARFWPSLEISKISTCCGSRCQKTTSLTVHHVHLEQDDKGLCT